MEYLKEALTKFVDFETRTSRKTYWMFVLWFIISYIALFAITAILIRLVKINLSAIPIIFSVVFIIPSISIAVRRLHDIGKSGWWWFIGFIPIIGGIWLLVLLIEKGDAGDNLYGPNPDSPSQTSANSVVSQTPNPSQGNMTGEVHSVDTGTNNTPNSI